MTGNLMTPVILLLISLIGGLILLRLDARKKELQAQIVKVTGSRKVTDLEPDDLRGIRMAARRSGGLKNWIVKLSRVPIDLDQAHILPVPVVILCGAVGAIAAYWISHLYFSFWTALGESIVTGVMLIRGIFGWETRRYRNGLIRQLPDVIELLSSTVSAGLPAVEGLRNVAREMSTPTREQFERVMQEIDLGVTADAALKSLHRRTNVTEYAILGVTLGVQSRSGGRLVETVHTLAETIRQRLAIVARGHALAAESKLSAYVIAAMPVCGGALMSLIKPGYLNPLFTDPRGIKMLMIAIGTLLTGVYMMRWMIRGALRQ